MSRDKTAILNVEAWTDSPKTKQVHAASDLGNSGSGSSAHGGCGPGFMVDEVQCSPWCDPAFTAVGGDTLCSLPMQPVFMVMHVAQYPCQYGPVLMMGVACCS